MNIREGLIARLRISNPIEYTVEQMADAIIAFLNDNGVAKRVEGELPEAHISLEKARSDPEWWTARGEVFHYRDLLAEAKYTKWEPLT